MELDGEKLKKLKRGEAAGYICAAVCAAAIIYFIVCFAVGEACVLYPLKLSAMIAAPLAGISAAAGAAYCNLKFGGEFDRALTECVRRTFIENAELMRPEKTSLGFVVKVLERSAEVKVNNFKEKTVFDFSPFGRLSAAKRSAAFSEIADVLSSTFLRLYGRGIRFKEVYYSEDNKKGGRVNFIIKNGEPDKRAYKNYLKRK